jgi:hypothetical protein
MHASRTHDQLNDGVSNARDTTVDELREAGVCLISATQTPLSLYAAFDTETKADVFMANLRTQIHFRAADEKGAKILSEKMGERESKKHGGGYAGGKPSSTWQLQDMPWIKATQFQSLSEGQAVVKHPLHIGRPQILKLPYTGFTQRNEAEGCHTAPYHFATAAIDHSTGWSA